MCTSCRGRERTVLESIPHATPRANDKAEWIAGEQRAGQHPEAHVHFDLDRDAFTVVAPAELDNEMEIDL
ncbi:hypothetical protein [Streptomyces sp. RLA2-12]|uniref:hypothetical protein n=1 Tax=Streptomyces sp. RLA2-12 TaxID=2721242 RepID=UPI00145D13BE|nr:hypothetical protein [Streptomyces sp. RLA2-12]NMI63137.1 hypothetical protein [Streptomyces sp. RLA2-12]